MANVTGLAPALGYLKHHADPAISEEAARILREKLQAAQQAKGQAKHQLKRARGSGDSVATEAWKQALRDAEAAEAAAWQEHNDALDRGTLAESFPLAP